MRFDSIQCRAPVLFDWNFVRINMIAGNTNNQNILVKIIANIFTQISIYFHFQDRNEEV